MRNEKKNISTLRQKRAFRVRNKLKKHTEKPRLSVRKTNKHLFVQLIDDMTGNTLCQVSTLSKASKEANFAKKSKDAASYLGSEIAKVTIAKGIENVVFDRSFYKYHGLIATVADSAREAGLKF